jgi:hypothetical protein
MSIAFNWIQNDLMRPTPSQKFLVLDEFESIIAPNNVRVSAPFCCELIQVFPRRRTSGSRFDFKQIRVILDNDEGIFFTLDADSAEEQMADPQGRRMLSWPDLGRYARGECLTSAALELWCVAT